MPRFSANLTFLYTEAPFLQRLSAAAEAGFRSVEFMAPYDHAPDAIEARRRAAGLRIDLFNVPAGDMAGGERGIAALPGREVEFRAGVEQAIGYATTLGTRKLNCLVGLRDNAVPWEDQYRSAVTNLHWAAERVGAEGITLLVEQLCGAEVPNFFLDSLPLAERVLDDVGSPFCGLQFDVYHVQRAHGDVVTAMRRLIGRIRHVQIADSPDRGEPGTGELNFGFILGELDRLGYEGRVGLEYRPSRSTPESLEWIEAGGWHVDA